MPYLLHHPALTQVSILRTVAGVDAEGGGLEVVDGRELLRQRQRLLQRHHQALRLQVAVPIPVNRWQT